MGSASDVTAMAGEHVFVCVVFVLAFNSVSFVVVRVFVCSVVSVGVCMGLPSFSSCWR